MAVEYGLSTDSAAEFEKQVSNLVVTIPAKTLSKAEIGTAEYDGLDRELQLKYVTLVTLACDTADCNMARGNSNSNVRPGMDPRFSNFPFLDGSSERGQTRRLNMESRRVKSVELNMDVNVWISR